MGCPVDTEPEMQQAASRAEARRLGLRTYSTGKPCFRGHCAARLTSTANCLACLEENKGASSAYFKRYYQDNAEKIKARSAAARAANPGGSAAYYAKNKERSKANAAAWRAAHPDRAKETGAKWRAAHPGAAAAWRAANRGRELANKKAWKAANVPALRVQYAARRARKRNAAGKHTAADIAALLKLQRGRCAHTWCKASLAGGHHTDPVLALSRGGSNDRRNLQLLCAPCNLRKHAKHPIDFARENGLLL